MLDGLHSGADRIYPGVLVAKVRRYCRLLYAKRRVVWVGKQFRAGLKFGIWLKTFYNPREAGARKLLILSDKGA